MDSHSLLSKLPFKTTKYGELHYINPINLKCDAYTGPGTNLNIRCNRDCSLDNLSPKDFNRTEYNYNQISEACHAHDHRYDKAGDDLSLKHEAD